ncbi:MAG: acetyl ornithine aminotransferase family protein [Vicinamibacterales bacterium]|nr:acetyl ornithine aminotransferase family protein [Vicinamibacterales bacterium]
MDAPNLKTPLPGPKAKALIDRDDRVVSPSYTRGYPFVIARGLGAAVEDVDGNVFLDCAAGIAVNSTGHAHPAVVQAIIDQAQKFLHMSGTDFYYEPQVRLAEEMDAIAPFSGPKRTFFSNSGTEANEAAMKLARYHSKRHGVIAFLGSFHGRTLGSLSLTSSKALQRKGFGPPMGGTYHAPYATCYRCPVGLKPETCQAECLGFLEDQVLMHLVSPDEVAAVFVEPIQGEGGYIVPATQFHERLRALTKKHGMILIADEVQSGMGRTGKMFAMEHFGVEPDMITSAKGIASGMPLGVTTARAEVMDWTPGAHASTFGGNPVSCAAAMATITLLKDSLVKNSAEVGAFLMDGLTALKDKHQIIGDVRGRGLMIGVELVRDRQTKERASEERDRVVDEAFARGMLILGAGRNAVRFSPPLVLTKAQAETAIRIFDESLSAVTGAT